MPTLSDVDPRVIELVCEHSRVSTAQPDVFKADESIRGRGRRVLIPNKSNNSDISSLVFSRPLVRDVSMSCFCDCKVLPSFLNSFSSLVRITLSRTIYVE